MAFTSIVVPAFNAEKTLADTLCSLQRQTCTDFEVLVVNDGSSDKTAAIAAGFCGDPRFHVIHQKNRGLAGARNTGIARAKGDLVAFCDADDMWEPEKLACHRCHLAASPTVGISYAGSALISEDGVLTGQAQRPRLHNVDAGHIFKRNPVGNGSAAVIRRAVFDEIAFRPRSETERDWYFDETFRQSEDIECWLRIALTTSWAFEGIPGLLTRYRINSGGLSAATDRQLAAWERMVSKLSRISPKFFAEETVVARAYQLRYLNRRAISDLDRRRAVHLARAWLACARRPLWEEPLKSGATLAATALLAISGPKPLRKAMKLAARTTRPEAMS
ncbi:glycosyltransferase family 2 protein [Leisingera sp. S232]|uniref:glycosyltransferase family 2 protein n=1 Tax=Leisingera sp. S232 TaxID=3415132 RepID=UPI003C7AE70D